MGPTDIISIEWPRFVVAAAAGLLSGVAFGAGHAVYDVLLRGPLRALLTWIRGLF